MCLRWPCAHTQDDILLREKIEQLKAEHPTQLRVLYVLDQPPPNWDGGSGYITSEMLREHLPDPLLGSIAKVT